MRQHLQACDLLLEQINACAAPPGRRPEMEFPAGIMRKAQPGGPAPRLFCEIPAHVVPESPFDVALGLGFNDHHQSVVHLTDESEEDKTPTSPRLAVSSSPEFEATTSCMECEPKLPVCIGPTDDEETSCDRSTSHPRKDSGCSECDDTTTDETWTSNDTVAIIMDSEPNIEEVPATMAPIAHAHADADGDKMGVLEPGERRRGKCSRGTCTSPERMVGVRAGQGQGQQETAVKIMAAASYYRERAAAKTVGSEGAAGTGSSAAATTRRAMCRIEAFVIRSRSARSVAGPAPIMPQPPLQQQQLQQQLEEEAFKKTMTGTWYREVVG